MKRIIVAVLGLAAIVLPVSALDPTLVEADLATLFQGIGSEVISTMPQADLLGTGLGDAAFGDFPHLFLSFSADAVFTDGIAKVLDQQPSPFAVLKVPDIITSVVNGIGSQATDLYHTTRTGFLYPNTRVAFGVGLAGGVELIGQVAWWPEFLTDAITGLAGLSGLSYNHLNAVLRVREKVLISDAGGFPGVSVGAGYGYASFEFGYSLAGIPNQDISGISIDFSKAALSFSTSLNTAGIDLLVSKKLAIFVPYLGASAWYRWGSYTGSLSNFTATVGTSVTVSPTSTLTVSDMGILFVGGLGIRLGGFGLNFGGSYDPRTNHPAAQVGMSFQG